MHISLAWRFAEVCTPLEPAVSLTNDTSGASLGNGVRRAPGFHISSTRYFGMRKRGRWGTSFQELMWLFSLASSPRQSASLPLPFLVVVVLLHTQTFSVSFQHSLSLSSYLPFSFSSYFLICWGWFQVSERGGNACTGEGGNLFINLFIVCEIKRVFFFFLPSASSPLFSWLRQMNV